jgi:hypothetical protein
MAKTRKALSSVSATIAAGTAMSDAADLRAGVPTLLLTPDDWSAANVSFQVSTDGTTFFDLIGADDAETHLAMGADRAILLPGDLLQAASYVRIRSGSSAHPVPQAADRVFTLVLA